MNAIPENLKAKVEQYAERLTALEKEFAVDLNPGGDEEGMSVTVEGWTIPLHWEENRWVADFRHPRYALPAPTSTTIAEAAGRQVKRFNAALDTVAGRVETAVSVAPARSLPCPTCGSQWEVPVAPAPVTRIYAGGR